MKIIIESEGSRRLINSNFRLYGSDADLKLIADAIKQALDAGLVQGWVEVGQAVAKDTTTFPFDITATDKPTYPFAGAKLPV